MSKTILINDTSNDLHYGCKLVIKKIEGLCEKNKIEIVDRIYLRENGIQKINKNIKQIDSVIINGEGTIHHESNEGKKILEYAKLIKENNKKIKIYLINSTIQNISYKNLLKYLDKIYLRENLSFKYLGPEYKNKALMGDMTLYGIENNKTDKEGIIVGGSVKEKINQKLLDYSKNNKYKFSEISYTKNYGLLYKLFGSKIHFPIFKLSKFRKGNIDSYTNNIKNSAFMITGRFHDVCLCIKYKIPFYYIKSNSFKIQSLCQTIGLENREINIDKLQNIDKFKEFSKNEILNINKFLTDTNIIIEELFKDIGKN